MKIKISIIIITLMLSFLACNEGDGGGTNGPRFNIPDWEGPPPTLEPHGPFENW